MPKVKSAYFCQNCGLQSPKWLGRCTSCGEWNTFVEEVIRHESPSASSGRSFGGKRAAPKPVSEITMSAESRMDTGNNELNRVLGKGLVPGSVILIGGEPGIGKSTLMLQVALKAKHKILYVTGEESEQQIRMRAGRLGLDNPACYILAETLTQDILLQCEKLDPDIVIIDSIQTLQTENIESSAGSISQIRECTAELQKYAKTTATPVLLVGHITKDGSIAGPKVLEHMVDAVLQFEGDRNYGFRILRSVKNRFGSTSELGIYEMNDKGLREVANPSEILLSQRDENLSGIAIAATIEGLRPMMIETQALVSTAAYGMPQRSATGFDVRRMNMLLAVLEKRCGFRLGAKDVFLNITGGISIDDPAIDLAVVCSILSSNGDIPIPQSYCFAAEVGLSGEIRSVSRIEQRIAEAGKLGFERIYISRYSLKQLNKSNFDIEITGVGKMDELFMKLFG